MDLKKLKKLHGKAYNNGMIPREQAADDMLFAWVTQWDDNLPCSLEYRGEFNIIRKATRQILADLRGKPVQVDFDPGDEESEDAADLLDGLYRAGTRENTSIEAFDNADQEAVVCGVGAWELFTEYQTNKVGDNNQVIRRRPLYEANNCVMWDPNAKRLDKSDARYCSVLVAYSEDGYKELVEELTGEEPEGAMDASFAQPEQSYGFPWVTEDKDIYVANFYYKEKVKKKILLVSDPFGGELTVDASELKDVMDELIDAGYEVDEEREIESWQVTKYIASGVKILEKFVIAGTNIPVIPEYGERQFVEGVEYYEGVVRLAKDPQRLRNIQLSYLADIASRSPRSKPIWTPEQLKGHEWMHEQTGSDDNLPYKLQNRFDNNGNELPLGPVAATGDASIPPALVESINLSRQAVEDVANPGLPQNIADPDLSGKAVLALQNRMDMQSMVHQQNRKHAKRHDGVVYAGMAAVVYDAPRTVQITLPDGTQKTVQIMESVIDEETGNPTTINDLTATEWNVYSDIGPDFSSRKEETVEKLTAIIPTLAPDDPMRNILTLKLLQLMEGEQFDDVRDYVKKQLILLGITEPETDEEKALVQNQQQQTNPQEQLAKAEGQARMMEGQAALQNEENDKISNEIDMFKAQTDRMKIEFEAQKAGFQLQDQAKNTDINAAKAQSSIRGQEVEDFTKLNKARMDKIAGMSDADLLRAAQ